MQEHRLGLALVLGLGLLLLVGAVALIHVGPMELVNRGSKVNVEDAVDGWDGLILAHPGAAESAGSPGSAS